MALIKENMKQDKAMQVVIDHENDIIYSAQKVLNTIKNFTAQDQKTTKELDTCTDELTKIIASSQMFIKILEMRA